MAMSRSFGTPLEVKVRKTQVISTIKGPGSSRGGSPIVTVRVLLPVRLNVRTSPLSPSARP